MDPIKILVIVVLFAIIGSLGSALFHLSQGRKTDDAAGEQANQEHSRKMARSLTIRVGLSVVLFILLMLAWKGGLISPHGLAR
jgi:hypothetical protein